MEDSYYILSYADDPLGYGDEQGARALYERAFAFYGQRRPLPLTPVKIAAPEE